MSPAWRRIMMMASAVVCCSAAALADEPRAIELMLPETSGSASGGAAWWWRVMIGAVVSLLGAALIWWGMRGTAPAAHLRAWFRRHVRARVDDAGVHKPLAPRDVRRVARACGIGPRDELRLEAIAREMGLASPLALFVLPHAASEVVKPRDANPAAGKTRRSR